jgi:hypothetical protein
MVPFILELSNLKYNVVERLTISCENCEQALQLSERLIAAQLEICNTAINAITVYEYKKAVFKKTVRP